MLVSIVTPTFPGRERVLRDRCMPSVRKQDFKGVIEHIIVSDRNPDLGYLGYDYFGAEFGRRVKQVEINESWRNPVTESPASIGAVPWHVGSLLALGDFVGFLGDDDEYLPDHVSRHVQFLEDTSADFSIGPVAFHVDGAHQFTIGDDSFQLGHLDSDGIFCRVRALSVANWSATPAEDGPCDWRLVRDWLAAGLKGVFLGGDATAIHHDGWAAGKTGRPDRGQ